MTEGRQWLKKDTETVGGKEYDRFWLCDRGGSCAKSNDCAGLRWLLSNADRAETDEYFGMTVTIGCEPVTGEDGQPTRLYWLCVRVPSPFAPG